jgi:hypothetical protein
MEHWRKLLGVGALGGVALILLLVPARRGEGKGNNQPIIIATASANGEISPCG